MPFAKLGLTKPLLRGVQSMGYGVATPIQLRAIPPALEGRDLIASAQTGTGKTAAFALPALQRLGSRGALRCLVLEPTRELAMQVETSIRDLARMTDLRVLSLYGGVGYGSQRAGIKRGVDVVVATPGRLEDYLARGEIQLHELEILVLDEVDRMLDIGFMPAVKRIVSKCPKDRQTLFFSATLPPEIGELAAWALRNPERIEIDARQSVAEMVAHGVYLVEATRKFELAPRAYCNRPTFRVRSFSRGRSVAPTKSPGSFVLRTIPWRFCMPIVAKTNARRPSVASDAGATKSWWLRTSLHAESMWLASVT